MATGLSLHPMVVVLLVMSMVCSIDGKVRSYSSQSKFS